MMVEFVCDDHEIEKALRKLHKQFTAHGGVVHDAMTFACKNGDFILTMPPEWAEGEKILVAPKEILLPIKKYDLAIENDDFVIKSFDDSLNKAQRELMETMLELYNLTGKIRQIKQSSTIGLLKTDPALLSIFTKDRGAGVQATVKKMKKMEEEAFWHGAFFKSRVLGFREKAFEAAQAQETKDNKPQLQRTQVLMPIIDFLNHHPMAGPYFTTFNQNKTTEMDREEWDYDKDGIAIIKSCPVAGSAECFVKYGPYDAYDTFFNYNFVEKNTMFVRSCPLTIKIPGIGTIEIIDNTGRPDFKKLPERVKDLRFFLPLMRPEPKKKKVTLSHLLIPQEPAPRALRRVLNLAINALGLSQMTEDMMRDAVLDAEARVIAENIAWYEDMLAALDKHKPAPGTEIMIANAREAAAVQLEKIQNYPFFDAAQQGRAPQKAQA